MKQSSFPRFSSSFQFATISSPFPEASDFLDSIQVRALPEAVGLGVSCLGVILSVLLVRSFRK